jgi:fatty acid desaturase
MSKNAKIILIREGVKESIIKDTFTFAWLIAVIGAGAWLDSIVLQWVGLLFWVIFFLVRLAAIVGNSASSTMTPDDARKWLDENYPTDAE